MVQAVLGGGEIERLMKRQTGRKGRKGGCGWFSKSKKSRGSTGSLFGALRRSISNVFGSSSTKRRRTGRRGKRSTSKR